MNSARWGRVRSILERALETEPAAREALIDRECGADSDLKREVESLLGAQAQGSPLEVPDGVDLSRAFSDPNVGRRIGPYRIERAIGSGGMGVVYLAGRVDADFGQRVALKLIKRGMDTAEVLAQFRRERALLASLEHPSIARLLDGGSTDDGLPWLAMEFVEGRPIDAWCAERELTVRDRLTLFLRVSSAVRHAHQRLIVHRDLKPSNILVAADGTPKLLDFGIAKLLASGGDAAASPTVPGERRLTPDYASPEQCRGEPITTASDVYSLGVVLYELLTGENPLRGVPAEMRTDPARPSTRLSTQRANAAVATARASELRGDLDTIVLKAMAGEVAQRYASVEALELDLRRFLDGLPIEARPATLVYRLRKFVVRNRLAVTAGAAVTISLVAGLLATRAGYVEALRQRARADERRAAAERESSRANSVLRLVREMIAGASPHDVKDKDYTLRQLLDEFDARMELERGLDPDVESTVRQILGQSYRELGLYDTAERHLMLAIALLPEGLEAGAGPPLALATERVNLLHDRGSYEVAESECSRLLERIAAAGERTGDEALVLARVRAVRGDLLSHLRRNEEAEFELRTALETLECAGPQAARDMLYCLSSLITVLERREDLDGARELGLRALSLAREHAGARSAQAASVLDALGHVSISASRFQDAVAELLEALSIERALRAPGDPHMAPCLSNLGRALTELGRLDEAEPLLREAIEITRKGLGGSHPSLAANLTNLGDLLQDRGDFQGAAAAMRESLDIRLAAFGELSLEVARSRNNLATVLRQLGRLDEAEEQLRRSLATRRKVSGDRDPGVAAALGNLGATLLARGDLDGAESNYREALSILRETRGSAHVDLASAVASLATILQRRGALDEAVALAEEALAMRQALLGAENQAVARSLASVGEIRLAAGDLEGARIRLVEAEALQRRLLGEWHPSLARTLWRLADLAQSERQPAVERERVGQALAIWRKSLGDTRRETREAAARLAWLLEAEGDLAGAEEVRREMKLDASDAVKRTGPEQVLRRPPRR